MDNLIQILGVVDGAAIAIGYAVLLFLGTMLFVGIAMLIGDNQWDKSNWTQKKFRSTYYGKNTVIKEQADNKPLAPTHLSR